MQNKQRADTTTYQENKHSTEELMKAFNEALEMLSDYETPKPVYAVSPENLEDAMFVMKLNMYRAVNNLFW